MSHPTGHGRPALSRPARAMIKVIVAAAGDTSGLVVDYEAKTGKTASKVEIGNIITRAARAFIARVKRQE